MQNFWSSLLQDPYSKDCLQVVESTASQVEDRKFCGTTLISHRGVLKSHGISKIRWSNASSSLAYIHLREMVGISSDCGFVGLAHNYDFNVGS